MNDQAQAKVPQLNLILKRELRPLIYRVGDGKESLPLK